MRPPICVAPLSASGPPSPMGAEAQNLGLDDLSESGRVVQFDHRDVVWPDACLRVGFLRGHPPDMMFEIIRPPV